MKSRMILRWTGVAMAILTGGISQAMDLQGLFPTR